MGPHRCFICRKSFYEEMSCQQHLYDAHDWPFNINLNDNLETPKPWVCPYCPQNRFPSKEHYLYHVLNNCPSIGDQLETRHDEVLEIILDAAKDAHGDDENFQINSVLTQNSYYHLPHGIQNKPNTYSPDILIYNRKAKEAVIIELSVPWESNIPKACEQALTKMDFWSAQFEDRKYKCFCYNVEIGSRGFVPRSFYWCLKNLFLDVEDISKYAQKCQDVVIKYSQYLIDGRPEGSDDDDCSDESDNYNGYCDNGYNYNHY